MLPLLKPKTPDEQLYNGIAELHYRLNVAFECMRLMGLTEGQLQQAQESIKARLKLGVIK